MSPCLYDNKAARELAQRESLSLEEAPLVAPARPEEEALALLREVLARMEVLEAEVKALREENARLREPSGPWSPRGGGPGGVFGGVRRGED